MPSCIHFFNLKEITDLIQNEIILFKTLTKFKNGIGDFRGINSFYFEKHII